MLHFNLHSNEKLIKIYRQPELVLSKTIFSIFFAIYLPWFFIIKYGLLDRAKTWLLWWTMIVFFSGVYQYLLWHLNANVLTTERLVAVHYKTLLHREIMEAPLHKIQTIRIETKGLLPTLLNYGTLHVHLNGLTQNLSTPNLKAPQAVKDDILNAQSKTVQKIIV